MEKQIDYSSIDFDYNYNEIDEKEKIVSNIEQLEKRNQDIFKDNSTESVTQEWVGLKPTREIIRGSVVYEQNRNNN